MIHYYPYHCYHYIMFSPTTAVAAMMRKCGQKLLELPQKEINLKLGRTSMYNIFTLAKLLA